MLDAAILSRLFAPLRSLWRGVGHRSSVDAEMREEFQHHMELRAEDLVRGGLSRAEAERRARIEFGQVETHRETGRASRGLRPFDQLRFSWLDVKLGGRMLARYPGITLVGGLAMAFAIAVGAGTFEFIHQWASPSLPLPEGERIVGVRFWDRASNGRDDPLSGDLYAWRESLNTIDDVGGFRLLEQNLAVGDGAGEPLRIAEISASAFRVTRVPPALGRVLVEDDEKPGAPRVVVLGYRLWETRFDSNPDVVGQVVRLGGRPATVVGVMRRDYAFPVDESVWTPLRWSEMASEPGEGPRLRVFGRLAPGATIEQAEAEIGGLTETLAREAPERYEHLSPQVLPYAISFFGPTNLTMRAGMYSINLLAVLFVVLICGNVALLMFARAATREREILVRNALGASRSRIVAQLFVEALVLGGLAAGLGLAAAAAGLRIGMDVLSTESDVMPFWMDGILSPTTVAYAVLLTILAALVAGVGPALKVTRSGLDARLRQATAGGGGLRMGGVWSTVIVAQIAATVLFTAVAFLVQRQAGVVESAEVRFQADEYLVARLEMDGVGTRSSDVTDSVRDERLAVYAARVGELEQRLGGLSAVQGVAVAERMPLMDLNTHFVRMDEGGEVALTDGMGHYVGAAAVGLGFFEAFEAPVVAGRLLDSGDLDDGAHTVVVNHAFVERVLGGRSAVGRRLQYDDRRAFDAAGLDETEPWYEIVGVVPDLVVDQESSLDMEEPARAFVYHPLRSDVGASYPLHVAARVRGDPTSLAPELRRAAAEVSPELRLYDVQPLDRVTADEAAYWRFFGNVILLGSAIALCLSLAGIYAVMSFTVSRRTREIGIRVAMGAAALRVVMEIFRRPLRQVALGVVLGMLGIGIFINALAGTLSIRDGGLLLLFGLVMVVICAAACVGPTLRALRIEPMDALRSE